jgi:hypothetical protein
LPATTPCCESRDAARGPPGAHRPPQGLGAMAHAQGQMRTMIPRLLRDAHEVFEPPRLVRVSNMALPLAAPPIRGDQWSSAQRQGTKSLLTNPTGAGVWVGRGLCTLPTPLSIAANCVCPRASCSMGGSLPSALDGACKSADGLGLSSRCLPYGRRGPRPTAGPAEGKDSAA